MGPFPTSFIFIYFRFSIQLIVNKICRWLDSNRRSLVFGSDRSTYRAITTAYTKLLAITPTSVAKLASALGNIVTCDKHIFVLTFGEVNHEHNLR